MDITGIDLTHPHKTFHTGCAVSSSKCLQVSPKSTGTLLYCYACKEKFWVRFDGSLTMHQERQQALAHQQEQREKLKQLKGYDLPADFSYDIPAAGLSWLASCGWGPELIQKNNAGWSDELSRVIIPLTEGWQGRYIKHIRGINADTQTEINKKVPKWHSQTPLQFQSFTAGSPIRYDGLYLDLPTDNPVVVVEDIMSAARVSNVLGRAIAALGTPHKVPFKAQYRKFVLWFDDDQAGHKAAIAWTKELQWQNNVRVVFTKDDPKYYGNDFYRSIAEVF